MIWITSREELELLYRKNRRKVRSILILNKGVILPNNTLMKYPFRLTTLKENMKHQ
jgi:hypothetical protein